MSDMCCASFGKTGNEVALDDVNPVRDSCALRA